MPTQVVNNQLIVPGNVYAYPTNITTAVRFYMYCPEKPLASGSIWAVVRQVLRLAPFSLNRQWVTVETDVRGNSYSFLVNGTTGSPGSFYVYFPERDYLDNFHWSLISDP